jgi:hypothetical protein
MSELLQIGHIVYINYNYEFRNWIIRENSKRNKKIRSKRKISFQYWHAVITNIDEDNLEILFIDDNSNPEENTFTIKNYLVKFKSH